MMVVKYFEGVTIAVTRLLQCRQLRFGRTLRYFRQPHRQPERNLKKAAGHSRKSVPLDVRRLLNITLGHC